MGEPFIKIEDVSYIYDDCTENSSPALRRFSLAIENGEFVKYKEIEIYDLRNACSFVPILQYSASFPAGIRALV